MVYLVNLPTPKHTSRCSECFSATALTLHCQHCTMKSVPLPHTRPHHHSVDPRRTQWQHRCSWAFASRLTSIRSLPQLSVVGQNNKVPCRNSAFPCWRTMSCCTASATWTSKLTARSWPSPPMRCFDQCLSRCDSCQVLHGVQLESCASRSACRSLAMQLVIELTGVTR